MTENLHLFFLLGYSFTVDERDVSKDGFHSKWSRSKKQAGPRSCKNCGLMLMHNMLFKPIPEAIQQIFATDETKGLESVTFFDKPWQFLRDLPNWRDMM